MNCHHSDKFSTMNYYFTNKSFASSPGLDTSFTPISFNSFPAVGFHSNYYKTLQENEQFEKLNHQRKQDQDFMNKYFSEKTKFKKSLVHSKSCLKITEAKMIISEVIFLKKQLEEMLNNVNVSGNNFNVRLNIMKDLKKDICDHLLKFDLITVKSLKDKIKLRLRKRNNIRKRKEKLKQSKEKKLEDITKKHEVINKVLNEKAEGVNNMKREENFKRQADSVLHEVRRKNFEAKKIVNTLNALSKLRELRSQQEISKGGYVSSSLTDTFNSVINYLQEKSKKQLELYQLEEKGLKVMLEESTLSEVNSTKSKYETIFYQWEQGLFGENVGENDISERPGHDLEYFIEIRREWDKYIVQSPNLISSNIPVGWVVPLNVENEEWHKFLKKKKFVT